MQDGFAEKLKGIQSKVDNLHTFTNIERVEQVASFVREIKKDLLQSADEARTFNNREALFDVDVREYTELQQINKAFDPYYDLWLTVDEWLKSVKHYKTSSFLELDSEGIEKHVGSASRTLAKNVKFFEKNSLTGCLAIAKQVKASVEEFKPSVPIVTSLCNPAPFVFILAHDVRVAQDA